MYTPSEIQLMCFNAEDVVGSVIFNNTAQTEQIIYQTLDNDNKMILNEVHPLGTTFAKLLNDMDKLSELGEELSNYIINPKTGKTFKDLLGELENTDYHSIERHSDQKKRMEDEIDTINENTDEAFLLRTREWLQNMYLRISHVNIFLWYQMNWDPYELVWKWDETIEFFNQYLANNEWSAAIKCLLEIFLEIYRYIWSILTWRSANGGFIETLFNCGNDFGDGFSSLNNKQRAYLYRIIMGDEKLAEIMGFFEYESSKTLSVSKDISLKNLSWEEQVNLIKECSVDTLDSVDASNIRSLLNASLTKIIEYNVRLKKCANCGKYFIAHNRSDTMYCDDPAPQNPKKTCKEYASQELYYEKVQANPASKLHRNIYQQKQMLAKRNPDITEYKADFEKFKTTAKNWRQRIKKGTATESDYLQWLKDVKEKKVTDYGKCDKKGE